MSPEDLYKKICGAADLERTVRELTRPELIRVHEWLETYGAGGAAGVPKLVMAALIAEAAARYLGTEGGN